MMQTIYQGDRLHRIVKTSKIQHWITLSDLSSIGQKELQLIIRIQRIT